MDWHTDIYVVEIDSPHGRVNYIETSTVQLSDLLLVKEAYLYKNDGPTFMDKIGKERCKLFNITTTIHVFMLSLICSEGS